MLEQIDSKGVFSNNTIKLSYFFKTTNDKYNVLIKFGIGSEKEDEFELLKKTRENKFKNDYFDKKYNYEENRFNKTKRIMSSYEDKVLKNDYMLEYFEKMKSLFEREGFDFKSMNDVSIEIKTFSQNGWVDYMSSNINLKLDLKVHKRKDVNEKYLKEEEIEKLLKKFSELSKKEVSKHFEISKIFLF